MRFFTPNFKEVIGLVIGVYLAHFAVNAQAMGQKPPKGTWSCDAHATCTEPSSGAPGPGNPGGGPHGPSITTCYYYSDYLKTQAESEADAIKQCKADPRSFENTCKLDGCTLN